MHYKHLDLTCLDWVDHVFNYYYLLYRWVLLGGGGESNKMAVTLVISAVDNSCWDVFISLIKQQILGVGAFSQSTYIGYLNEKTIPPSGLCSNCFHSASMLAMQTSSRVD